MPTPSEQDRVTQVMLRVCTGKKAQRQATRIAEIMDAKSAATAMVFFEGYGTPEFILLSKIIEKFMVMKTFTSFSISVLAANIPVLTSFGVDTEQAVKYLISIVSVSQRHVDKEDFEYFSRGMMVGFLAHNDGTLGEDHLRWLGRNAESIAPHIEFLQQHRSASRHICNLALSGITAEVAPSISSGAL